MEKSHSTMVHEAMRQEISRLSVSSERFPSAPIAARTSARDDGVGEQHPVIKKRGAAAGAAGCVEGLWKKVLKIDQPYGPEGS